MKFFGVGIQDEGLFCASFLLGCRCAFGKTAFARGVVDVDSRLNVVTVCVETHACSVVFYGQGLYLHAACNQVVVIEDGRGALKHMVARLFNVVGHLVFKGQHAFCVQIARAGDEIFRVGVFAGKLISD